MLNPVARTEELGSGLGDSPVVFAVASHALLFLCIHVTSGHPTQCHCLLSIGHEHIGDGSTRSNFVCCLVAAMSELLLVKFGSLRALIFKRPHTVTTTSQYDDEKSKKTWTGLSRGGRAWS